MDPLTKNEINHRKDTKRTYWSQHLNSFTDRNSTFLTTLILTRQPELVHHAPSTHYPHTALVRHVVTSFHLSSPSLWAWSLSSSSSCMHHLPTESSFTTMALSEEKPASLFEWTYSGVDCNLPGNCGDACIYFIPTLQKILESSFIVPVCLVEMVWGWKRIQVSSSTPAMDHVMVTYSWKLRPVSFLDIDPTLFPCNYMTVFVPHFLPSSPGAITSETHSRGSHACKRSNCKSSSPYKSMPLLWYGNGLQNGLQSDDLGEWM